MDPYILKKTVWHLVPISDSVTLITYTWHLELCHTLVPDLLWNSQQGAQDISALHLHDIQQKSENNRGRWAAERKTHVLELKECAHSILASPTRKLYTPIYTRVPLQGYSTKPCEGRESWGRGFWCYSLLIERPPEEDFPYTMWLGRGSFIILHAAWRCPSLLSADSHLWFRAILLIHLHLIDIICWPQTPVLPALPAL